jgi:hypothetical protein
VPGSAWSRPRTLYGPICAWSRCWTVTIRCAALSPRGAERQLQLARLQDQLIDGDRAAVDNDSKCDVS